MCAQAVRALADLFDPMLVEHRTKAIDSDPQIASGTYKPTNYGIASDNFPAPAPPSSPGYRRAPA